MRPDIASLAGKHFDVAIIGGGINGAAAAQHLAAAGYSVVLVERNDYASAASNRSSRVLHSGLRYFAPVRSLWEHVLKPRRFLGKIRSAIESMSAMGDIAGTMPERVRPLPLYMPIYREMPYSGWHVDIGVWFLGLFKRNGVALEYKRFPAKGSGNPPIFSKFRDQDQITAFTQFRDFQFVWPERICLDAIMNAKELGALTRNYTTVSACSRLDDGRWDLRIEDTLSPADAAQLTATVVINTAGVWMDSLIRSSTRKPDPSRRVIGIKGAHIVVQLPPEFRGQGVAALNSENEAIFLLPWGDRHYIGPTETVYQGDIDDVRPGEEDIAFLIEEANHLMPSLGIKREDILMAWAGVRPITFDTQYPKGRRLPFSVVHDLEEDGLPNMIALTWGTLNLHRISARNLVKAVRRKTKPSQPPKALVRSARRFPGSRNSIPAFASEPDISLADLAYTATHEDALTLVDVLFRRTHLGWRPDMTREELHRAASAVGIALGWSKETIEEQVSGVVTYMQDRHLATVS